MADVIDGLEVGEVAADLLAASEVSRLRGLGFASDLATAAAPAPGPWVRSHGGWPALGPWFRKANDLAIPIEPTPFSRRAARQPAVPYQLWTALRHLGYDDEVADGRQVSVLTHGHGPLATIEDVRGAGRRLLAIGSGPRPTGLPRRAEWVRVSHTDVGAAGGVATPGPTLESKVGTGASLDRLFRVEREHASTWLSADRTLGTALLLGPMTNWLLPTHGARRRAGYLTADGKLTEAGKWRLAYVAEQSYGHTDHLRAQVLAQMRVRANPVTGRYTMRNHLVRTQRLVLDLMAANEWVPLGVEISLVARAIYRLQYARPDALMWKPPDTLVWVELLRRKERTLPVPSRLGSQRPLAHRYARLRREILFWLANVLARPVEYYLRQPGGDEHLVFKPGKPAQMPLFQGVDFGAGAEDRRLMDAVRAASDAEEPDGDEATEEDRFE